MKIFILILLLGLSNSAISQTYKFSGDAGNNDFFDENNWKSESDNSNPPIGTIDPSKDINLDLIVNSEANADGDIYLGTGSLLIENGSLKTLDINGGTITIGDNGYADIADTHPVLTSSQITFTSAICWLRTLNVAPVEIENEYLSQIKYNGSTVNYPAIIRLDNYYNNGTVIRPNDNTAMPLQIFSSPSLQGTESLISLDSLYIGEAIPNGLNNSVSSFILKKGYMATLAVNDDGTGKSKVYIASESDLTVNNVDEYFSDGISFIRTIPWNWVTKKGTGGGTLGLNNTWLYRWSLNDTSDLSREFAPMTWGRIYENKGTVEKFISKYKATHAMAFNEPDDCNAQSGKYGNLCIVDTAVMSYKLLMQTGLRLVSPGCREEEWNKWLKEFHDLATENDLRIDVIAVHWYDWGGSPKSSPNANPENVFNRFKNYLSKVYELYGLPIWITEFNANTNRSAFVNLEFMKLAIPYLESLSYVERYAWFQPVSGVASYYDGSTYTQAGHYYKNTVSTPTIPEETWNGINNIVLAQPTNIEDHETQSTLKVFPNPVHSDFVVSSQDEIEEIHVYNILGGLILKKHMIHKNHITINAENWKKGIYVAVLRNNRGEVFTKKIIKM